MRGKDVGSKWGKVRGRSNKKYDLFLGPHLQFRPFRELKWIRKQLTDCVPRKCTPNQTSLSIETHWQQLSNLRFVHCLINHGPNRQSFNSNEKIANVTLSFALMAADIFGPKWMELSNHDMALVEANEIPISRHSWPENDWF